MDRIESKNRELEIACRSETAVLITGQTGSGKTRLAREIHDQGSRKNKAFITVNLASLHEGTIESELFGHERGAFTGADQRRVGRLELANGGTVFLDEIGELSPRLQARLLEFLQSKTVVSVGGNREIKLNVRVIAATHRNLAKAVERGDFREDLFHRLRVISIHLASISDRGDEFDQIVHRCLEQACLVANKSLLSISEQVAIALEKYEWPGNFRELKNVLEYSVLSCEGKELQLHDLPLWFGERVGSPLEAAEQGKVGVAEPRVSLDFHAEIARFEQEFINRALRRFRGRINQTARQTGMNKTTLLRRMKIYGITPDNACQV